MPKEEGIKQAGRWFGASGSAPRFGVPFADRVSLPQIPDQPLRISASARSKSSTSSREPGCGTADRLCQHCQPAAKSHCSAGERSGRSRGAGGRLGGPQQVG